MLTSRHVHPSPNYGVGPSHGKDSTWVLKVMKKTGKRAPLAFMLRARFSSQCRGKEKRMKAPLMSMQLMCAHIHHENSLQKPSVKLQHR